MNTHKLASDLAAAGSAQADGSQCHCQEYLHLAREVLDVAVIRGRISLSLCNCGSERAAARHTSRKITRVT
jgi:hypothetical protein